MANRRISNMDTQIALRSHRSDQGFLYKYRFIFTHRGLRILPFVLVFHFVYLRVWTSIISKRSTRHPAVRVERSGCQLTNGKTFTPIFVELLLAQKSLDNVTGQHHFNTTQAWGTTQMLLKEILRNYVFFSNGASKKKKHFYCCSPH